MIHKELYALFENYAQMQIKKLWLAEQSLYYIAWLSKAFMIWFVKASH